MYVIREVLHCKPGKVRPMVDKFKTISGVLTEMGKDRSACSRMSQANRSGPSLPKPPSRRSRTSSPWSRP